MKMMSHRPPQFCSAFWRRSAMHLANSFSHAAPLHMPPPSWPGSWLGTAGSPAWSQKGPRILRKRAAGMPTRCCTPWAVGLRTSYVSGTAPLAEMLHFVQPKTSALSPVSKLSAPLLGVRSPTLALRRPWLGMSWISWEPPLPAGTRMLYVFGLAPLPETLHEIQSLTSATSPGKKETITAPSARSAGASAALRLARALKATLLWTWAVASHWPAVHASGSRRG
mmetsp:Transcript_66673/g.198396  ORF Transcript_66673/g.198396 Transcript_66673/m.198396 type:complete len:224 (+) Transcript_66673:644-1315(+)